MEDSSVTRVCLILFTGEYKRKRKGKQRDKEQDLPSRNKCERLCGVKHRIDKAQRKKAQYQSGDSKQDRNQRRTDLG